MVVLNITESTMYIDSKPSINLVDDTIMDTGEIKWNTSTTSISEGNFVARTIPIKTKHLFSGSLFSIWHGYGICNNVVMMVCFAPHHPGLCSFTWYKNGKRCFQDHPVQYTSCHGGTYTCRIMLNAVEFERKFFIKHNGILSHMHYVLHRLYIYIIGVSFTVTSDPAIDRE